VHKTSEEKFGKDYVFIKEVGPYLAETLWKDEESLHCRLAWSRRLEKSWISRAT
jgi:hypothetical protein